MFYNAIFLMTVIRIIEMQPVDYLSLAACVIHFHSSNDRFGINPNDRFGIKKSGGNVGFPPLKG